MSHPDLKHDPGTPYPTIREDLRYIVIEGVIGAGKTTLARRISEQYNGLLVLEEFEENPFLERFYKDKQRWAFQTQLSFLASRFKQQKSLQAGSLFHNFVVSDYLFDKDRIFAHLNLNGDELQLYETLYNQMQLATPTPDLVVYLQASTDRLMQNIRKRNRPYEKQMDAGYIESLNEAYNYYFFRFDRCPLLIVNVTHIDFVKNEDDFNQLMGQMVSVRYKGTTYFNPSSDFSR